MLLQGKKAPTGLPEGVVCASTTAQADAAKKVRNSCCHFLHPDHLKQQPEAAKAASWCPRLPAVRKLCRVMHTVSPPLPLQVTALNSSQEGKWLAQQGITPISWLGGGGCAQVYM